MIITKSMLGLHKSPRDERDYLIKSFIAEKALPKEFNIVGEQSLVRNQGTEGSCAGFAGTGLKEWQEKHDTGKFYALSPRYIYEYAKIISGHSEGTTLKAIFQVLYGRGICYEKDWPYIAGKPGNPGPQADINAAKHRVLGYARVTDVEELKQAIFNGYPNGGDIFCGLLLYKGAIGDQAKETGVTPDPSCFERMSGPLGGHALIACGWNDNSPFYKNDGHILFKGSWGIDFGAGGYHYFSYKNVGKNMMDAMALIDVQGSAKILTVKDLPDLSKSKAWV